MDYPFMSSLQGALPSLTTPTAPAAMATVATDSSAPATPCYKSLDLGWFGKHCLDNLIFGGIALVVVLIGVGGLVL